MSNYTIAVIPGDGIGPEVTSSSLEVLEAAAELGDFGFTFEQITAGAEQWRETGVAITNEQFEMCRDADAMLMGAIGMPDAVHQDGTEVAGDVIFRLRFDLDLFAGVRPVRTFPGVPSLLADGEGIDYIVVRENIEGLYASRGAGVNVRDEIATDTIVISRVGTEKVVRRAFELAAERAVALSRPGRVTCVDKANVLASYAFFRKVFDEVAREFPDIEADHVYVDAMTLYQIQNPRRFDVVVAENMFGDIISDLSAATVGGLGLAASGDIGHEHGLFQPAHGTAPTIAGQGIANPAAMILSAAMMLDWLGSRGDDPALVTAARRIREATIHALDSVDSRTADLGGTASTADTTRAVISRLTGLYVADTTSSFG